MTKKAAVYLIVSLLVASPAVAQSVFLERQVLSPFVMDVTTSTHYFNMTVGQPEFITSSSENYFLTQGFGQPILHFEPEIEYTITFDQCTGEYLVEVTSVGICVNMENVELFWNNELGTTTFITIADSVSLFVFGSVSCNMENTIIFSEEEVSEVNCDTEFYQLITPNNDGANDGWIIENVSTNLPANAVKIFNRWGIVVWSGTNYDNDNVLWTGRSNEGAELPDGTYFYTLETIEQAYSGFVELQR